MTFEQLKEQVREAANPPVAFEGSLPLELRKKIAFCQSYAAPEGAEDDDAPGPMAGRRAALLGFDGDQGGVPVYDPGFVSPVNPKPSTFAFDVPVENAVSDWSRETTKANVE